MKKEKQLQYNVEEVLDMYLNGMYDYPDDYPEMTKEECREYVTSEIYDMRSDGGGHTFYGKGICDDLRFLGNDVIYAVIDKYAEELGILKQEQQAMEHDEAGQKTESENPSIWVVLSHDDQSDYTEPKYWDTARDSSDIIGIYSNEKAAREVVGKLKKEEEERLASLSEDYEEEQAQGKYYTIQQRELKYEAEYPSSEKIVTVGYYVPEKPEWRENEKEER